MNCMCTLLNKLNVLEIPNPHHSPTYRVTFFLNFRLISKRFLLNLRGPTVSVQSGAQPTACSLTQNSGVTSSCRRYVVCRVRYAGVSISLVCPSVRFGTISRPLEVSVFKLNRAPGCSLSFLGRSWSRAWWRWGSFSAVFVFISSGNEKTRQSCRITF